MVPLTLSDLGLVSWDLGTSFMITLELACSLARRLGHDEEGRRDESETVTER